MMTLEIKYQEHYSRGELLLRTFLGLFYIVLPHIFLLFFFGLASGVLQFLAFWVIMFTGRYPQSWFEFQVKFMRWNVRLNARLFNISDGYPAFGLDGQDEYTHFDVSYPERISRTLVLARLLLGWIYVGIPHGIILGAYGTLASLLQIINFFIVLVTGKMPRAFYDLFVAFMIWSQRVSVYMSYMTDEYPPFHGRPDKELVE